MNIRVDIESKIEFIATPVEPCIWRFLLWHTGKNLPGHTAYKRERFDLLNVYVDNKLLYRVFSLDGLDGLRSYDENTQGAYYHNDNDNEVYIKLRHNAEQYSAFMSAQPWLFYNLMFSTSSPLSDRTFYVFNNKGVKYGILSGYKLKISAEPNSYSQIKFNTLTVNVIWEKIKNIAYNLIGTSLYFSLIETNERIDRLLIENITRDIDTAELSLKDMRASFTDMVIDQQYDRNDYKNDDGRIVMDEDTGKTYKKDAIGYCIGVPADCLNGYAFDSMLYRRYRVGYGKIEVDYQAPDIAKNIAGRGVEVEMENGYKVLSKKDLNNNDLWWTETIEEVLPSGAIINTTVITVRSEVAHPPQTGYTKPDYECTPRKIRVTGTFHTEITGITNCYIIFKYLIERYNHLIYNADWFNIPEIQNELAVFNNHPIGIYIDKPTEIWKVIAQLQNGCIYGWQFYSYKNLFTVRVDLPTRPVSAVISKYDILNINSLKYDFEGTKYSSNTIIQYSRIYKSNENEEKYKEYKDEGIRQSIIALRNTDKTVEYETLLKEESDARIRFNEAVKDSIKIKPRISGIKLEGRKWFNLRQYDMVDIDLDPLSDRGIWRIIALEIDYNVESVVIDIKKAF